jgi:GNAT superfamily N-acetyltransferase
MLPSEKYDCFQAYDGEEALERVAEEAPDLILLDVMMPVKNGFEVTNELKNDPNYRDIPIILQACGCNSHKMKGDHEDESLHLGLYLDGELVSIASCIKASLSDFHGLHYQLRGMATAETHQGKGYGRELLKATEGRLEKLGVDLLWCNARTGALGFYTNLGYQILGSPFEVPGIGEHYKMFKKIGSKNGAEMEQKKS